MRGLWELIWCVAFGTWLWISDWEAVPRLEFRKVFLMPQIFSLKYFFVFLALMYYVPCTIDSIKCSFRSKYS